MSDYDPTEQEAVAVIGMAGRFPGARDVAEFWQNVRRGVETIAVLSPEELAADGVPAELYERPDYVPAKGVVEDPALFDADFFGLTPREAELVDPQHRLFLECCWQACEDAGYDVFGTAKSVGVYGGASTSTYLLHNLLSNPEVLAAAGNLQARLANDRDFLTTRVSYKLDLRGPSFSVQTACSTSLLAVHLACQALLDGECSLALAGGVSLSFPHRAGYVFQDGGIRSADGHCRAFDAAAQGSVEGNGVGVVVLKRLSEALADGDAVRAVIRATAANNDGASKVGFTAPSVESQARVIADALALAGVPASSIGYVEGHGSGTALGDPIEVEALTLAFAEAGGGDRCALGSVKTSIGHLDAAAGVAALIKTVQALRHGVIPPSPYFTRPNPAIDFASGPFYVNPEPQPWPVGEAARRAGVSSFGIGGTNVHAVLEAPPPPRPAGPARPWQLLVLSARSESALEEAAANLRRRLVEGEEQDVGQAAQDVTRDVGQDGIAELADVAFTLAVGRRRFRCRRALVCRDRDEAVARLNEPAAGVRGAAAPGRETRAPAPAFLFPGLGDHHAGMTRELYRHEPFFRREIDRAAEILTPLLGVDPRPLLYPDEPAPAAEPAPRRLSRHAGFAAASESEADRRLHQTRLAHPLVFAVEVALARLLMEWGVRPTALLGYSLGEYAAACVAGVFSFADGLRLVAGRARLIDELPAGAMLAVPLAESEVAPVLDEAGGELAVAASNGSSLTVVGGREEEVEALAQRLSRLGVACQRLRTTHAFHTPMLEPVRGRLRELVSTVPLAAPRTPFLSNATGGWIRPEEAIDPGYWAEHTVRTVRFTEGLGRLFERSGGEERLLVEVGPGQGLATLARQHAARPPEQVIVSTLPDRRDGVSELGHLFTTLGRLWCAGATVDWAGFYRGERRRRLPLPTYPFERRRYWVAPGKGAAATPAAALAAAGTTTSPRAALADWFYLPSWERARPLVARPPAAGAGQSWLLFCDALGLGERLAAELRRRGHAAVTVTAGEGFTARDAGAYTVHPGRRADYDALLAAVAANGLAPSRIAHLFCVTAGEDARGSGPSPERAARLADLGLYSLLFLAQALGEHPPATVSEGEPLVLTVVSNHLQEITGEEPLCPEKALLLGPVQVIPQELPHVVCRNVDLPAEAAEPAAAGRWTEALVAELEAPVTAAASPAAPASSGDGAVRERLVALRGRHRWHRTYRPLPLPAVAETSARLRRNGVYLITGGVDETSLAMAEQLVSRVGARLALLVPGDFPRRDEWPARLTAAAEDADAAGELAATLERLLALEERAGGALVTLPVADLGDVAAVAPAVAAARQRFRGIDGVLHTASATGSGLIQLKTRPQVETVLAPKVAGTLAVAEAVAGLPLDFFALFSSTSAVTGGLGQVAPCAANAFLDAFARRAAAAGGERLTVAVGWGSFRWEDDELPAGVPELHEQLQRNLEIAGIGPDDACEALARLLDAGVSAVVSPRNLAAMIRDFDALTTANVLGELAHPGPAHDRPELAVAYAAPATPLEEEIAAVWCAAFGLARVGVNDDFFELAGNSLLAIQIVTRLRAVCGVELAMTALFEAPTVAELARRVEELRAESGDGGDGSDFLALLGEIEGLSDGEIETRLVGAPEEER